MTQVAKDRRTTMSTVAQSTYLEFVEMVRTSALWSESDPEVLTVQLLGLRCMEIMALRLKRQGYKGSVSSPDTTAKLVNFATEPDESALDNPSTSPAAIARRLALSILEFASTSDAVAVSWSTILWERFVSAIPEMLQSSDGCHALALKVCINLTNNNALNCDTAAQTQAIEAVVRQIISGFGDLHDLTDEVEIKSQLDSLILSLGLMINLAEFSDAACEKAAALESNGLASLVGVFLRGQERVEEAQSEEETQGNVAYGFLAVLLGNLCQNGMARSAIRACLPRKSLQKLVAAIDEFAQYNRKVDSQTFDGEEGREVWEQFTRRLMTVVARLQEFED